jgi:hypothetical protein
VDFPVKRVEWDTHDHADMGAEIGKFHDSQDIEEKQVLALMKLRF